MQKSTTTKSHSRASNKVLFFIIILATVLALLFIGIKAYFVTSETKAQREAESLLTDPMGDEALLGMKLLDTTISPSTSHILIATENVTTSEATRYFELPKNVAPDDLAKRLIEKAKKSGWTVDNISPENNSFHAKKDARRLSVYINERVIVILGD